MPLVWNDEKWIYYDPEDFREIALLYVEFDKNEISEVSINIFSVFI